MFWINKKKVSERPFNYSFTVSSGADIAYLTFWDLTEVTYLQLRSPTTAATVQIWGDDFSSGNPVIAATGVLEAGSWSGSVTINEVKNKILLNNSQSLHFFSFKPWLTRRLYFQAAASGTYQLTIGAMI